MRKERSLTPESAKNILELASYGATPSLMSCWYAGNNKGLIGSFSKYAKDQNMQYFVGSGAPKLNAVAWIGNKKAENIAWIIVQTYRNMFKENASLHRDPYPQEIMLLHITYNVKYDADKPIHINHIASVIFNCRLENPGEGLTSFTCCCSRNFLACAYNSPRRCPICRSGISKRRSTRVSAKPFRLDLAKFKKVSTSLAL
jgi:hypothetical protein